MNKTSMIKEMKLQRGSLYGKHRKQKRFSVEWHKTNAQLKLLNKLISLFEKSSGDEIDDDEDISNADQRNYALY